MVNRQAGVDLEHYEPYLPRGPNVIICFYIP
jgi:hypothetical protein